jgi:hypothetical protein
MPVAPVVPKRNIVFPPLEAYLRVVILRYEINEVWEQEVRLISHLAIDASCEAFVYEY